MTSAPEQSRREKARLSICNPIECRSRDCSGSLLIQGEQRPIVANILSVEDRHRTIVQNQPTLLVTNGYDRVAYLVFIVLHDDKTQIIRKNAQLAKRNVFQDCIIFTVAGSIGQRLKR